MVVVVGLDVPVISVFMFPRQPMCSLPHTVCAARALSPMLVIVDAVAAHFFCRSGVITRGLVVMKSNFAHTSICI